MGSARSIKVLYKNSIRSIFFQPKKKFSKWH
nr:MAG TPA: hypothetical protein [Caudoviricetes sp.]